MLQYLILRQATKMTEPKCDICFFAKPLFKLRCQCTIKVCKICVTKWVEQGKNECPQCRKPMMKNQQAKHIQKSHKTKEFISYTKVDPPNYLPFQFFQNRN